MDEMEAGARVAGDDEKIALSEGSVAVVGGRATTSKLEVTAGEVRLPGLKLPRGESHRKREASIDKPKALRPFKHFFNVLQKWYLKFSK
ncbi:hypothetical protein L1887_34012 [Cichorium endivia]|nr:hypothetical protein L1887_34012 [Cichorium endivia]